MSAKSKKYTKTANAIKKRRIFTGGLACAVLACFVLFFAIANAINPVREFSDNENRALKTLPQLSAESFADGSFFKEAFESYSDQFVFRDALIGIKSQSELLSGDYKENDVIIGKDDYLFAVPETPSAKKIKLIQDALNTFAANHKNVDISFILTPCAASVLTQKLPASAGIRNQSEDISSFGAGLDSSINFFNAGEALAGHKDEYIYYRTDHHWTSRGAFYVFNEAREALGIGGGKEPQEYRVSDTFYGTAASESGIFTHPDSISIFDYGEDAPEYYVNINSGEDMRASMFYTEMLHQKDKYQVFLGGNHPILEISTNAGTGRNLLIFKDSYANSFVQFLYPFYDKIIMIDPRYYYDDANSLMNLENISDVLFLYSGNILFTDTSLADCLS